MPTRLPFALLAAVFACLQFVSPSHAAARDRVFVASYGSDSNPCTFGSPCKTFQNAVNVVAAGGEVTAIDSAGFGTITINKAVTITSPNGVEAGIAAPASGSAAITINAGSSDIITLNGLTLDGANVPNANGIQLTTGGGLNVRDSVIRNFSNYGIYIGALEPLALLVSNTHISDISSNTSPNASVYIGGKVTGAFDHVEVENGLHDGVILDGETSNFPVNFTISNSVVANNALDGILCYSVNGKSVLLVQNSMIAHNAVNGLDAIGTGAILRVTKSAITDNGTGFATSSGGILETFGDNALRGNATDGAPTTTVPLQ